jgi:hypothetical protein
MIYFSPSIKKEILAEKQAENNETAPDVKNNETEDTGAKDKNIVKDAENADLSNKTDLKEDETSNLEKIAEPKNSFEIKQQLVSWGYSLSKNRNIDTIIIHSSYNALGGDVYGLAKLIEEYKSYGVSPHYLIDRSGNIYQLVSDQNIAYHAGESKMPDGRTNVNNFSLGIEIMTTENDNPSNAQYSSLMSLIGQIKKNHKITSILGHNQIAPGRKTDPWNFNWNKIDSVK